MFGGENAVYIYLEVFKYSCRTAQ